MLSTQYPLAWYQRSDKLLWETTPANIQNTFHAEQGLGNYDPYTVTYPSKGSIYSTVIFVVVTGWSAASVQGMTTDRTVTARTFQMMGYLYRLAIKPLQFFPV